MTSLLLAASFSCGQISSLQPEQSVALLPPFSSQLQLGAAKQNIPHDKLQLTHRLNTHNHLNCYFPSLFRLASSGKARDIILRQQEGVALAYRAIKRCHQTTDQGVEWEGSVPQLN